MLDSAVDSSKIGEAKFARLIDNFAVSAFRRQSGASLLSLAPIFARFTFSIISGRNAWPPKPG